MIAFTPENTVGEIAAVLPLSVRVFEQLEIDYCCGGQAALSDACKAKGLDLADVIHRIQTAAEVDAPAADWLSAPLNSLIDHILATHHAYLKSQLPRLSAMLAKILAKHEGRHGDVLRPLAETFRPMRSELESHLMKEETILFPLIRQLEAAGAGESQRFHCGSVRNPIRVMVAEHDTAGEALGRLRELTAGYTAPKDACNTFRAFYAELAELERDLHRHIHLENNILFPRAVELEGRQ
jgi:regulator of cell morphogenesis and NO signaling